LRECRQEWRHGKPEARSTTRPPHFKRLPRTPHAAPVALQFSFSLASPQFKDAGPAQESAQVGDAVAWPYSGVQPALSDKFLHDVFI